MWGGVVQWSFERKHNKLTLLRLKEQPELGQAATAALDTAADMTAKPCIKQSIAFNSNLRSRIKSEL